jgi:hypothetical protein
MALCRKIIRMDPFNEQDVFPPGGSCKFGLRIDAGSEFPRGALSILVPGALGGYLAGMLAAIRIETVLAVMVVLNLIGLSIAAYVVMRKK